MFNNTEKKWLIEFLENLKEHQGNAGCNDWYTKATPEAVAFMEAAHKWDGNSDPIYEIRDGKIFTYDWFVTSYLLHKIKNS